MDNTLSRDVQMQFLRPAQLEARAREFPVVYVPFGMIEWHGRHLPLGNDAIKAHAFVVKVAEQFGGAVYPPLWFHSGFDQEHLVPVYRRLFEGLTATGFRVIVCVTGHWPEQQVPMIEAALGPVIADGTCAGIAVGEVTLCDSPEAGGDHAAKWETSNMMFFYPDRVDIAELGDGPLAPDMQPPDGIGGLDPREHASAEVGRRNAELGVEAIGRKARELLESLPPDQRDFSLPAIAPGHWWCV